MFLSDSICYQYPICLCVTGPTKWISRAQILFIKKHVEHSLLSWGLSQFHMIALQWRSWRNVNYLPSTSTLCSASQGPGLIAHHLPLVPVCFVANFHHLQWVPPLDFAGVHSNPFRMFVRYEMQKCDNDSWVRFHFHVSLQTNNEYLSLFKYSWSLWSNVWTQGDENPKELVW